MTIPERWKQRYAIEMIERAADYLDAHVELQQDMDKDGIYTVRIILHMPERKGQPLLPPAQDG